MTVFGFVSSGVGGGSGIGCASYSSPRGGG